MKEDRNVASDSWSASPRFARVNRTRRVLQRQVEVRHATVEDGVDESARQTRRVEVGQTNAIGLATQCAREFDEWLRAALVEHLDRLAAAGASTIVSPTREVLGDQD